MSTARLTPPGILLQELLGHWKKEFPKRASGGWWALSGFALQTSVYLLRFFQRIEAGAEPGSLAEMEHLSDIISPADGKLTLIQVKRTLTRHALISAVEEAYLITDLCRRETPALLDHLRFQIACQKRMITLGVADLRMSEVIESAGNVQSWSAMLSLFDMTSPITEEPDALDQLHTVLWNSGIRNTEALIERCVGRLLMSFGTSNPTVSRQIGRELADYFFAAERHDRWEQVGKVLTATDILPEPQASENSEVLTGQQPRLEHLIKGFFRERPEIFQMLWQTFTGWVSSLASLERVTEKVPVFWISGRSGEGKSVLLVQLVAEALRLGSVSPLLQLKEGDDLPRLVSTAPERAQLSERSFGRIFAVVDDVYDLHKHERDEWDATILSECDYRPPSVALITCGPTEQQEQFAARLSGPFEVTTFEVPTLDVEECRAFLSWYELRTGQKREWDELTTENPLLVQFMFELAHGERMPEFARRFSKRLSDIKLFDAALAILAMNALYMDAPLSLLTTDKSRDALDYLCKDEQLHFRLTVAEDEMRTAGVRLAHSHLSWLLFIEWVEPPTTLAKAWARELAKSLRIFDAGPDALMAGNLLYRLLHTERLAHGDPSASLLTADRRELARELYRLHIAHLGGRPSPQTLARWLEFEYKLPGLQLDPDPGQCATAFFAEPTLAPSIRGDAILWLWLIAESRTPQDAQEIFEAVKEFGLRYSGNPGIGGAIALLLDKRRSDPVISRYALDWLTTNNVNPEAFPVLRALVLASPSNKEMIERTFDWLAVNEEYPLASSLLAELVAHSHAPEARERAAGWLTLHELDPSSSPLISALIAADPHDAGMRERVLNWLAVNDRHPRAFGPLSALVAARPGDADMRELALGWLAANESHPNRYQVIGTLVAANPSDADVIKCAFDWLAANGENHRAYHVLMPLLAANPDNAEVRERTLNWLAANETHPQACGPLAVLVAASPNASEIKKLAIEWLAANEAHPQAYELITTLVAANATDIEVRARATDWLAANEAHPQAHKLIATLVAANATDIGVRERATDWLAANPTHSRFYELLNVMIARSEGSKEWLELGEQYVTKPDCVHPEVIFGVLLTAGKADPKFIEMAFDFMAGTANKGHRRSLLYHLNRALARNFHNAVRYLDGPYVEQRKKTVCASIAVGMNRFPDTIAAFALDVVSRLDPSHVYHILWNAITRGFQNDFLDEMITQWLVDNHRRRGYGGMLAALHKNPSFWERLVALGMLPKNILEDFNTRRS